MKLMKNRMLNNGKSTFLAVTFFGVMTLLSCFAAKAQGDANTPLSTNPLFTTTGPVVLAKGSLLWNNAVDYYHIHVDNTQGFDANLHSVGYSGGLRWGVGKNLELSMNLSANYNTWDTVYLKSNTSLNPTIGAMLLLFEGRAALPQTSFYTKLGITAFQTAYEPQRWDAMLQPEIGLLFRNGIGKRFAIDYQLGWAWNNYSINAYNVSSGVRFGLYGRWLAGERLMLGVGMSNINAPNRFEGNFEACYLIKPDLQIVGRAGVSGSKGSIGGDTQVNGLLGVCWKIR